MSQQQKTDKESSFDLVKVAAGAVGAMASAVLLSTLGAAGTITGAALGSVIVTVAASMFSKGVDVSKQGVSAAQALAARRVAQARSQVGKAAFAHVAIADEVVDGAAKKVPRWMREEARKTHFGS